jgi:hypothetical protein
MPLLSADAERFLNIAPVGWDEATQGLADVAAQALADELDALAVRATMLSAYVDSRGGGSGLGRREHAEAVSAARKRRAAVRKALGFAYPYAGDFTF